MVFSKKGDFGIPLGTLVSLIVTILVISIGLSLFFTFAANKSQAEESFEKFIFKIENLEDGADATPFVFQLPEGYLLVNFLGGQYFDGRGSALDFDNKCDEVVAVPKVCDGIEENCLAMCNGNWKTSWKETCSDDLLAYKIIDSSIEFKDSSCGYGLYREGGKNNVMTLYLQKKGDLVYVCDSKTCLNKEEEEKSKEFENFVSAYKSCQEDISDCKCNLDVGFLKDEYALNFEENKIKLVKIEGKQTLVAANFDTTIAKDSTLSIEESENYYVYQAEVTEYSGDYAIVSGIPDKTITEYVLVSPSEGSVNNKDLVGLSDNQITISENLYQKDGSMTLVSDSFSFDGIASCGEEAKEEETVAALA